MSAPLSQRIAASPVCYLYTPGYATQTTTPRGTDCRPAHVTPPSGDHSPRPLTGHAINIIKAAAEATHLGCRKKPND